jgi:hypothetical protein
MVDFAPGSAVLSPQAIAGLDKVAKMLTDRPALTLTVIGTANLVVEREAFKRDRLEAMIAAEKRRLAATGDPAANTAGTSPDSLVATQRPALLKEVYRRSDITKPRNLLGMAKDIPETDMEALLMASINVTDDVMRELAVQRGVAVRDYLASRQLPLERLFMGAVKQGAAHSGEKSSEKTGENAGANSTPDAAKDQNWTPHAELNLAAN